RPFFRKQLKPSLTWYPAGHFLGRHQLKVGTDNTWEDAETRTEPTPNGAYVLNYNGKTPIELQAFNYPVEPTNLMHTFAFFVTDTWAIGRVIVDAGMRYDHYNAFIPPQTKEPGPFSNGLTFPTGAVTFQRIEGLKWNRVVPR